MTKAEITATEKLLDLIRTDDSTEPEINSFIAEPERDGNILAMERHEHNSPEPIQVSTVSNPEIDEDSGIEFSISEDSQGVKLPVKPSMAAQNKCHFTGSTNPPQSDHKNIFAQMFTKSSGVKVGIDIQPNCIHLVKSQGKTKELLDCHTEKFQLHDTDDTPLFNNNDFKAILAQTLKNFCRNDRRPEIWCSFGTLKVIIHNIDIPKIKESEISNAVFWSTKKSVEFDPQKEIFDFSILKEIVKHGQTRLLTLVTLVSKDDISGLQKTFKDIGFKLTGISYPPAATQNLLSFYNISDPKEVAVHLRLKEFNSFIDLFCNNQMIFSREIKTDTNSFIESCQEVAGKLGLDIDEQTASHLLFRNSDESGTPRADYKEISQKINLTELPVIERLTRQLNRTFEYCANNFNIPKINTLCTSGEYILRSSILLEIQKNLDVTCKILPPLGTNNKCRPAFKQGIQNNLSTAAGLALSIRTKTKNFLYTYADRRKDILIKKNNRNISIATIIAAMLAGGLIFYQLHQVSLKKLKIKNLNAQLEQNYKQAPRSRNSTFITQALEKLNNINLDNQIKISRFQILAALSELNAVIPKHIKLTFLLMTDYNGKNRRKRGGNKSNLDKKLPKKIILVGYVNGSISQQDFTLLNFIKDLSSLNLARDPILIDKKHGNYTNSDIIKFNIELTVNPIKPHK